ncbi:hypothetical protein EYF80_045316 [Liparis tanakae]|uniref:Uncharacterized protein n=1 Tax=Liparis tanakae TaxID=230148 RepID=A0A4Z2FUZ6_9TELE|nr:hypothetical protein EYF80_045316 [Liparis tanakae]
MLASVLSSTNCVIRALISLPSGTRLWNTENRNNIQIKYTGHRLKQSSCRHGQESGWDGLLHGSIRKGAFTYEVTQRDTKGLLTDTKGLARDTKGRLRDNKGLLRDTKGQVLRLQVRILLWTGGSSAAFCCSAAGAERPLQDANGTAATHI